MTESTFVASVKKIREDARKHIESGAITKNYNAAKGTLLILLNNALATETICALRYKKHYYTASKLGASVAAKEFLEHAQQESEHADALAKRIVQLGGDPDLNPESILGRAHADYVDCDNLKDMIKENLIAERIAVDSYRELIKYIGNSDPTTRCVLEQILAVEEEHADDLLDVAAEYNIKIQAD